MLIRMAEQAELDQVKVLFREYFQNLREEHKLEMSFIRARAEVDGLPGLYAPPTGCLMVVEHEGKLAGCGAVRAWGPDVCEMKRMYLRPEARGQGVGRALAEKLLEECVRLGYRAVRVDMAATMTTAQNLFKSLGFEVVEPYTELPPEMVDWAVFMEKVLGSRDMCIPVDGSHTLTIEENPTPETVTAILDGLAEFNGHFAPPDNYERMVISLRDDQGSLLGGLLGATYWGCLHVEILWLREECRSHGYGARIMQAAEDEAVRRGCRLVHLDTIDFQAPDFYRKLGYVEWGVLEDVPPGHRRIFFRKELATEPNPTQNA